MTPRSRSLRRARAPAPLIALEHCSLVLDEHVVLDNIGFELRAGERWALIGPNGSGKTFLLKMLRGDVWPTPLGGERRTYRVAGTAAREPAGSKELIAYIGPERQDKYLRYDWNFTVTQVVTTGLFDEDIPLTEPTAAQRARVAILLKRFGLWRLRSRQLLSLSYGQQRLTLVARLFASPAKVLLLDEVFNGLDAPMRARLQQALARSSHASTQAWILTTHRPQELPRSITHVAKLSRGRLIAAGPATDDDIAGARTSASFASPSAPISTSGRLLIRLTNVDVYRDYRHVLKAVDWTISEGENWAIVGRNGSGKSSLLKLLYGDLLPALGGSIERAGFKSGSHIQEWKRRVGWVSPELQAEQFAVATIEEIILSGRYSSLGLNDPATASDRRAAKRWMRFFGLELFAARKPREVSYGQMRLVLMARAMLNDPELLLLDEPCTGLDPAIRTYMLEFIDTLARAGTQVVMAVHDPEDIVPSINRILRIGARGTAHVDER